MIPPLEYGALGMAAGGASGIGLLQGRSWWRRRRYLSDSLTGLADRRLFQSRVAHAQLRASRHGYCVAVLSIDVDELATVNNTMGRECGDQLLCEIARRLHRLARGEDTVARLSSDEFAILLEQVEDPTGAARAATRILHAFQAPLTVDGQAVVASLSIGISVDQTGNSTGDALVREAGIALARAKARGKRRYETFEPYMGVEAAARLTLEAELRAALTRDELVVHYQPIVELATGAVVGAEALARWAHPERGLLLPADFIAMAEGSGAIVPLGRAVLAEACRAAAAFRRIGPDAGGFRMSVNVSTQQVQDGDQLIADVNAALESSGLPPELLTLEITESSLLHDLVGAAEVVRRLRAMHVNVALDDFGTGYSSLAHVRSIPITGLKVDQSFVADLGAATSSALVRSILEFARELDITVVAEGVETEEQISQLLRLGCRLVQGHRYGDALPEAAFRRLLMRPVAPAASVTPLPRQAGLRG